MRAGRFRSSLSRSATLCAAVSIAFSKYAQAQWKPNAEVYVKPGDGRSYVGVDGVVPVLQDARSLAFADLKLKLGTHSSQEFNLGAGYRRYLDDKELWALGLYGAWDRRTAPTTRNDYDQVTLGAEARSAAWDLRANYYEPLTRKKLVGLGASSFAGFGVLRNGVFEEAMRGWDVEVGGRLPFSGPGEMRAYLAAYNFKGEEVAPKTRGTRVRLEFTPRQDITLGVSAQRDPVFGGAAFLELRYSFGKPPSTAPKTLKDRMVDPWVRDIDVVVSRPTESDRPEFRQVVQASGAVHVDSSKAAGGDGSFERPYDSTAACFAGKCAVATNNIIRLWQGASSVAAPYSSVVLLAGQTLWGQGVDIFTGQSSARVPVIGNAGSGITLANTTTVAGLHARGNGAPAIYGTNLAGAITIRNSTVTGIGGGGVYLADSGGGSLASTVSIANNTISANAGHGIDVRNFAGAGGSRTQTVTISGNTVNMTGNFSSGIVLRNSADAGTATQAAALTGNTVALNLTTGSNGPIYALNSGVGGGQASQSLMISGNTLNAASSGNDATVRGIYARNFAYGGTAAQSLTISGNTISASARYARGVELRSTGYSAGDTARQTVTLTGNTISARSATSSEGSAEGVYAANFSYNGATSTQSLTITGNTINAAISGGNPGFGIGLYLLNVGDGGSATQSVVVSGNTLSALGSASGNAYGIYGVNIAYNAGGSATQSLTISGNTILASASGYAYGLRLANIGDSANAGTVSQIVTLSGNTISATSANRGAYGVDAYNRAETLGGADDASASQSLTLIGNSIIARGFYNAYGLRLRNTVNGYNGRTASGTQSVVLTGNTISATSVGRNAYGIYLQAGADAAGGGTATGSQIATVSGNTVSAVTASGSYDATGVRLQSYEYNGGASTQTTTLSGNTINRSGTNGAAVSNTGVGTCTSNPAVAGCP